jgi:hypothetical protein
MENKSRINSILADLKELEQLLRDVLKEDIFPVSFFSRSFDLAHHLLKDLHILEGEQVEVLRQQMEEYRRVIDANAAEEAKPVALPITSLEQLAIVPEVKEIPQPKPLETLNDTISKKKLADLRKALSLNERFYFRKELFNNDEMSMNRALADLNEISSYGETRAYIREQLALDETSPVVTEFLAILEKRFC